MVSDFNTISESKKPLPCENGTLIACNSRVPCENGKLIAYDSRVAMDFRLFAAKFVIQIRHLWSLAVWHSLPEGWEDLGAKRRWCSSRY